jgi:glycerol-1-phosphate dehydrogenase [NAD(P)+]
MAEHMISHYLDMFAGEAHPATLHGEQVGVATLSVLALQNKIFNAAAPPTLRTSAIDDVTLRRKFGGAAGREFAAALRAKSIDRAAAARWNKTLAAGWPRFAAPLRAAMLKVADLAKAMRAAGVKTSAAQLGFTGDFYRDALLHARCIRDRFTVLDFAAAAGLLEEFAAGQAA